MNLTQLRSAVAQTSGLTAAESERAIQAILDTIVDTVSAGDKITLPGFGTFESRARAARSGRNPQTGAALEIAATTVPAFKPGAAFKSAVAAKG